MRVATAVKDTEDRDHLAPKHIEDRVGETSNECAARLLMDGGKKLRVLLNRCECSFDAQKEIISQAGTLLLIPSVSLAEILFGNPDARAM